MPLDTTILYCDHGFPVGGDCWRCWNRSTLDAESRVATITAERDEAQASALENMGRFLRMAKACEEIGKERDALLAKVRELEDALALVENANANNTR
jgi:hypothetical protein